MIIYIFFSLILRLWESNDMIIFSQRLVSGLLDKYKKRFIDSYTENDRKENMVTPDLLKKLIDDQIINNLKPLWRYLRNPHNNLDILWQNWPDRTKRNFPKSKTDFVEKLHTMYTYAYVDEIVRIDQFKNHFNLACDFIPNEKKAKPDDLGIEQIYTTHKSIETSKIIELVFPPTIINYA